MTNNYGHFAEPQAPGSVFAPNVTKGSVPICLLSMSYLSGRYHLGVRNVSFSEEHEKFMARYKMKNRHVGDAPVLFKGICFGGSVRAW